MFCDSLFSSHVPSWAFPILEVPELTGLGSWADSRLHLIDQFPYKWRLG